MGEKELIFLETSKYSYQKKGKWVLSHLEGLFGANFDTSGSGTVTYAHEEVMHREVK
jgi:hypothetical protein